MSSSEDDLIPLAMLRKKAKSPAAVKNEFEFGAESDSDDDVPLAQIKKRKLNNGKAKVPTSDSKLHHNTTTNYNHLHHDDDDDDDDDDDLPLNRLPLKTKPTPVNTKRKATSSKSSSSNGAARAKNSKSVNSKPSVKSSSSSSSSKTKVQAASSSKTKGKTSSKSRPVNSSKSKSTSASASVRKLKVHSKAERLDMAIKAFRWWKEEELPEGIQWRTLEHNGVLFPPVYQPHGIPLVYDGQEISLTPAQEEMASFYASIPVDGPQLGNAKTCKIFNANFFADFRTLLGKKHVIQRFDKCDFTKLRTYLDQQREVKKNLPKEAKALDKRKKESEQFEHGFALVDGHLEKVGNFRIEPPGLFRGRGEHPKTGTLKQRVEPEEVTVNVGLADRVPICNVPGHAWKEVIHRDSVSWLAFWNENVMGGIKYVWLAASSSFKGKADLEKYEKARRLKKYINKIRKDYTHGLKAKDLLTKQRSTAMWVIDVLALRVGNEKGEDEADTVGCCSLRVEHMCFDDAEQCTLTLSFLGKDSMPYNNTVQLAQYGAVGKLVYHNLQQFCRQKDPNAQVFDELSVSELNKHLSSLMPGLTAKVFRTFNASVTLEKELPFSMDPTGRLEVASKVVSYNDANRKVAILCNHQRTVPKSLDNTLEKMDKQLAQLKRQLKELQAMDTLVVRHHHHNNNNNQAMDPKKFPLKKDLSDTHFESKEEELATKKAQAHLFAKVPSRDQIAKKITSWLSKIKALSLKLQDKSDNKEVALGTSKINYMDPRITVAWCKRNEVPISAVFAKTLREKFVWAMDVPPDWKF